MEICPTITADDIEWRPFQQEQEQQQLRDAVRAQHVADACAALTENAPSDQLAGCLANTLDTLEDVLGELGGFRRALHAAVQLLGDQAREIDRLRRRAELLREELRAVRKAGQPQPGTGAGQVQAQAQAQAQAQRKL